MIKLDKNYSVKVNSTHGFELHYKGETETKEVVTNKGKAIKDITPTDTWYFPKLSLVLKKYFSLSVSGGDLKTLTTSIENIEKNIESFSKTFADKGELLIVK